LGIDQLQDRFRHALATVGVELGKRITDRPRGEEESDHVESCRIR